MGIFKKRRKAYFGKNIEPSCEYCTHSIKKDEQITCSVNIQDTAAGCKKYSYNPLKRIPKTAPLIKKGNYNDKDFSL